MPRKIIILALAAALCAGPANVSTAAGHGGGGFGGSIAGSGFGGGIGGGGIGGVHMSGLGGSFGGRLTGSRLGISGLGGFGAGHVSGVGTGFGGYTGGSGITGYSGSGLGNAPVANGPVHFSDPSALVGEQAAPSTGARQYIPPSQHYHRGYYTGMYNESCYNYPYHDQANQYNCPE